VITKYYSIIEREGGGEEREREREKEREREGGRKNALSTFDICSTMPDYSTTKKKTERSTVHVNPTPDAIVCNNEQVFLRRMTAKYSCTIKKKEICYEHSIFRSIILCLALSD